MLEHEGQAALFEMGEAVPDHVDAVIHTEMEGPAVPDAPKAEKDRSSRPLPARAILPRTFRQGGGFHRRP